MSDERCDGFVKWFNADRGYGFIKRDGDAEETEYFVHYSYINMEGYKALKANQRVSFVLVDSDKGIQAQDVIAE